MNTQLRVAVAKRMERTPALLGGFWYLEAPQKTAHPYAVFSFLTSNDSRDSVTKFEEVYLQINVYHRDGAGAESVAGLINSRFEDCESAFTLEKYHFERIERQFQRASKIEGIFIITIQYKIELTRK